MNILIAVGAWYHEEKGGSYRVATEFAEFLASSGHRVFYLCGSKNYQRDKTLFHKGVEVWRYPLPRYRSPNILNLISHIRLSGALARQIYRKYGVDYLNGHEVLQFIGAGNALRGRCRGLSLSVHSSIVQEYMANSKTSVASTHKDLRLRWQKYFVSFFLKLLERNALQTAHIVQTDSKFILNELLAMFPNQMKGKGVVSPAWVDTEKFCPTGNRISCRCSLGGVWDYKEGVLFFSLRRLVPRMGLDTLVKACGILNQMGKTFRVIIGGVGPEDEKIRTMIREARLQATVFLVRHIAEDKLSKCYGASDCFVLPTQKLEGFGLVILEAFASGTPVIATPVGAIPEVIGKVGQSGLTRDLSPESIAEKMRELIEGRMITNPNELRSYAKSFAYNQGAKTLSRVLFKS
jgi:glycosyltransferase involved in cell wall biosynthesis